MLVTIDLDAYENLPPRQLRAMLRALRFADGTGVVRATLNQLTMPGLSRSAVHRDLAGLERAGERYRIPARFRSVPTAGTLGTVSHETAVPEAGTTDSRAPAFKVLSSVSKETSERELSLSDSIPNGWREAAAAERRRADSPPVNLDAEWRKHLLWYAERDRPVRLGGWLLWVIRTRLDGTNTPAPTAVAPATDDRLPGNDRQQRQARDWARRGFWLRDGSWGPAPDQPGCTLPADLIAWCRQQEKSQWARKTASKL